MGINDAVQPKATLRGIGYRTNLLPAQNAFGVPSTSMAPMLSSALNAVKALCCACTMSAHSEKQFADQLPSDSKGTVYQGQPRLDPFSL